MKTLVITQPRNAELIERPVPAPAQGEVLLRIGRLGLCGSDLATYRGINPLADYPRIPGHEIGAVVERAGEGVDPQWREGREVLVVPYTSCGTCAACRQGRVNACSNNQTLGVQRDGALCEYIVAPQDKLIAAEKLSLREFALVEPLTIGHHAVARGRVTAADTVLVLGCGAIGLGAIAAAAQRGARVVAMDCDPAKLPLAEACGAVAAALESPPDVVIEAVGSPETFRQAVEQVAFAGRVVYIGYAKAPVKYDTSLFVKKELDILGSRNATAADFAAVIAMLAERQFPVDRVISHTVPLAEAPAALAKWDAEPGRFTKIHIEL